MQAAESTGGALCSSDGRAGRSGGGRDSAAGRELGSMMISVLICTRNRGPKIADAVRSVLANDHDDFEVVVIDQSTNDESERAIAQFLADDRFRYERSSTVGLGLAQNIGATLLRGEIIAFTDDDC